MLNRKYLIHGVCVESNLDFPEFTSVATGCPDIVLLRESSHLACLSSISDATLLLRGQYPRPLGGIESFTYYGFPDYYLATWHGLCEFQISRDGSRISCRPWAKVPWSDVRPFLVGRILPLALNLRGTLTLHSGAVLLPNGAIALAAKSGTGKSNMLTALACMGYRLIADDMLAVSERGVNIQVELGTSQVRLTEESLRFLRSSLPPNQKIESDSDKVRVFLREDTIPADPMPLQAVYLLNRRPEERGDTEIKTLPPKEALLALAKNVSNLILMERPQLSQQFAAISRLVQKVPVKTLSYSSGIETLPAVCQALMEDQGIRGKPEGQVSFGVGV